MNSPKKNDSTKDQQAGRMATIKLEIEMKIPDFAKMCRVVKEDNRRNRMQKIQVAFHQDAFAEDLDDTELMLLGKAIKYAGNMGLNVFVMT